MPLDAPVSLSIGNLGSDADAIQLEEGKYDDGEGRKVESDNDAAEPQAISNADLIIEPICIYRRGHPLAHDLRARVMMYLQQGLTKQAIANRLSISRSTVLRYQKTAAEQSTPIPSVRPRGGFRSAIAILDRQQILKLGEMLLQHPKLTIRELKQLAVDAAVLDPEKVPSDTTVWRAIRKLNLDFSKVVYVDPKGSKLYPPKQEESHGAGDHEEEKKSDVQLPPQVASAHKTEEGDLIANERRAFRFMQKQGMDGQLNPANLIFMDETNTRAFDQAHYAWGRKHQQTLLFRPKGMSATFNVIACIGVEEDTPGHMFLHYIIVPPRRDFRGVSLKWKPYEFRSPTSGIDVGYSVSQIQRNLRLDELTDLMKAQQLKIPRGFESDEALASELRRILVQVRTHGKVGMLREMPSRQKYLGGSIKAFRSTAADVVDYIEKLMVPFYTKRKFQGLAHECTEDSDGIIGCPDAGSHFSVPYLPPAAVSKSQLIRTKQRMQRQWQRAAHHVAVYSRSKRSETEHGKAMLATLQEQERIKQQAAQAAADALIRYERQLQRVGSYAPFQNELAGVGYKRRLSNKYLIWDCASTHGAVRITSARKKSFWHGYADKVGLKGVIFLPPRTPTLNPIELVFGFIKHQVRKYCPDEGYSPIGLIQAIHNAFRLVTPVMIKNWVKKAGYRFSSQNAAAAKIANGLDDDQGGGVAPMDIDEPAAAEEQKSLDLPDEEQDAGLPGQDNGNVPNDDDQLNAAEDSSKDCYSKPGTRFHRKRSIVCMDEHGTVIREKKRRNVTFTRSLDEKLQMNTHWATTIDMQNIASAVNQMPSVAFARYAPYTTEAEAFAGVGVTRRWSGLGPGPQHLQEMMPDSITKVQDGTLWEIDGIVEHKGERNGATQYLVRYKGYGPEYDEWISEAILSTATGAIKEYWARVSLRP